MYPQWNTQEWLDYFTKNKLKEKAVYPTTDTIQLSTAEKAMIGNSIAQFQLGESSEGAQLQSRARDYGNAAHDQTIPIIVSMFIKEEQKHGRMLAAFMKAHTIPTLSGHWLDNIFRRVRQLMGLDTMLSTLLCAELVALVYYEALGKMTQSPYLKEITEEILADETMHVHFQSQTIRRLRLHNRPLMKWIKGKGQYVLIAGTILAVWKEHKAVFTGAGLTFSQFETRVLGEFFQSQKIICDTVDGVGLTNPPKSANIPLSYS